MFLRNVLLIDAATCIACGALMSLGSGPLGAAMSLPPPLLFYAGVSLFPIAAVIGFVGARAARSPLAVWFVAGGNILWAAASLWVIAGSTVSPNVLGTLFITAQAGVVAALTALEIRGVLALTRRALA